MRTDGVQESPAGDFQAGPGARQGTRDWSNCDRQHCFWQQILPRAHAQQVSFAILRLSNDDLHRDLVVFDLMGALETYNMERRGGAGCSQGRGALCGLKLPPQITNALPEPKQGKSQQGPPS